VLATHPDLRPEIDGDAQPRTTPAARQLTQVNAIPLRFADAAGSMAETTVMSTYRSIMLLLRHSESPSPALARARALAMAGGASVHLFMFEHEAAIEAVAHVSRDVSRLAQQAFLRERSEWLQARVTAMHADGIDAQAHVVWGAPAHDLVIDKVLELKPDLVIKDIEQTPLPRRLLLTPLDWKLLRLCPVPLMLVSGRRAALPQHAVVAVDPIAEEHAAGALNQRLLEAARKLPGMKTVDVAHAFEPVAALAIGEPLGSAVWLSEVSDSLRALGERALDEFAAAHKVPPVHRHLLAGPPALTLPALVARLDADLLVLGTVHRRGLERLIIGSTAERVLQHADCDILAVKPAAFAERLVALRKQKHTAVGQVAELAATAALRYSGK
jgi:universal stress protein E